MPEKYKVTRSQFTGPSAVWSKQSYSTLTWQPSCNIPPVITSGNIETSRSNNSPMTYVCESHWIDGKLGLPLPNLPFNQCHHLVSKLELPERGSVKLKRYTTSEANYERDPGECGPMEFTKSLLQQDETLFLAFGPLPWLSLMGSGDYPLTWNPYLPIGTEGYALKIAQLDGMAMDSIVPQLDDGFSLPVFLFELFELKALVLNLLKLIANLPKAVWRLFSKPLAEISDHWLEAVFGWLPLVRDIKTIVNKLLGMRDSIVSYLKGANKVKTLYYKKGLHPHTFQPESWFSSTGTLEFDTRDNLYRSLRDVFQTISFGYTCETEVKNLDYFATARIEYRIPEAESLLTQIWAAFDHWGVNLSPSDVWEVIPFSFVIDWFVDVGPKIARLDKTNLNVQVILYDFCRTIKYRYDRRIQLTTPVVVINHLGNDDSAGWTSPAPDLAAWAVESYYRVPGVPVPNEAQAAGWHLPKGMTLITAPALGYSLWGEQLLRLLRKK